MNKFESGITKIVIVHRHRIDRLLEMWDEIQKKFNYYLDVITYMNKMQELDIIKYLLLDEDGIKLLNFLKIGYQYSRSVMEAHDHRVRHASAAR